MSGVCHLHQGLFLFFTVGDGLKPFIVKRLALIVNVVMLSYFLFGSLTWTIEPFNTSYRHK